MFISRLTVKTEVQNGADHVLHVLGYRDVFRCVHAPMSVEFFK